MIDIITFLVLVLSIFKGIKNGLVMAIFSFAGLLLGLLAAVKLSAVTAAWLEGTVNISARWLPALAFLLVFIGVVLLVNLVGKLIETTAELSFLGWANKAGGVVFYSLIYLLIWSVIMFYLEKLSILKEPAIQSSVTYTIIAPWGPTAIEWLAELLPVFKDVFTEIGLFLESLSDKATPPEQVI